MKIHDSTDRLTVSNIKELAAGNAESFREEVSSALPPGVKAIEIDLSDTEFVDSCGLGALIALYKQVNNGHEAVRRIADGRGENRGGGLLRTSFKSLDQSPVHG